MTGLETSASRQSETSDLQQVETGTIQRRTLRDTSDLPARVSTETTLPQHVRTGQERRRAFEDALLGVPSESSEIGDVLDNFARLCAAGVRPEEALRHAAHDARPAVRTVIEEAAVRASGGMAISEALGSCSENLPPLIVPAIRAWERNGQRDSDLRTLATEMRRLGEVQQRNTFFQIRAFMKIAEQRERKGMAAPTTRRSAKAVNASRGGISRRGRMTMRWTDLFVSLWRCNVPISEALEAAGEGCGNNYCRHVLYRAAERTREGVPLSTCLAETRLLSAGLIDRLRTGEASGRIDETLEEFARIVEGDANELGAQSTFMRRILPMILIASAVVIFLFGASMPHGDPVVSLIVALLFLPVAFAFWEIVFRQSINGAPKFGIGNWERKRSKAGSRPSVPISARAEHLRATDRAAGTSNRD